MFNQNDWILSAEFSPLTTDKWQQSIDLLADLFKARGCSIAQHSPLGFRITMSTSSTQPHWPYQIGNIIPEHNKTLIHLVATQQRALYIPNTSENIEATGCTEAVNEGARSYLGMPLFWPNGYLFGVLSLVDSEITEYKKTYLEMAENIRQHIQTDLELLVYEEENAELSWVDEMTGTYNRQGFTALATYKLGIAKRYNHNFGLMYFNLDNLGLINEQLGWEVGDKVLQILAEALDSELRESDIAVRLGDDDFAALVFIQENDDLENIAVRIQRKLNMLKQNSEQLPPITTSIGARWYEATQKLDIGETLRDIDHLMFAIKQEKKQPATAANIQKH